jgi:peptidoglycan/xylan/chitin deacetylase (PgdA/CDA1 family)
VDELLDALLRGKPLPPRAAMVTFDDGYRNVLELGLPILERYEIPAVLFVSTGPSERQELYWFDAMARTTTESQVRDSLQLNFADHERLRQRYRIEAASDRTSAPMTPAEVARFAAAPRMEIGAHTIDHVRLAAGSYDEQLAELTRSKATLEKWTGKRVRSLAFPFGHPERDYNADSVRATFAAGYDAAFTTQQAFATRTQNPLEISRFLMLDDVKASELAHRLRFSWRRTSASS